MRAIEYERDDQVSIRLCPALVSVVGNKAEYWYLKRALHPWEPGTEGPFHNKHIYHDTEANPEISKEGGADARWDGLRWTSIEVRKSGLRRIVEWLHGSGCGGGLSAMDYRRDVGALIRGSTHVSRN